MTKIVQLQIVDHHDEIGETLAKARDACNYISTFAKEHRTFQAIQIHQVIYRDVREQFSLRSQMAESCIRAVSAQYKGEHRQNRDRQEPVTFKKLSMPLNYPRDYRVLDNRFVSINTVHGRVKARYRFGAVQRELLRSPEWKIESAIITNRKRDGKIFLNIAIEKEVQDVKLAECTGIVGIDLGMINLAATVDSTGATKFYGGGIVKFKRYQHAMARQSLQSKGTRSAKRRLRALSGREKRFVTNENHVIAREIVESAVSKFGHPLIVLEDLTGIRKNPRRTSKGRRELNSWAFYQLRQFVEYKAAERGIPVAIIDPKYTSQQCPRCFHVEHGNRDKKNHWFTCRSCGFQSSDDRTAAINIRDRGVVSRYIRETRGLVNVPNAVNDDVETSPEGLIPSLAASPRL